MKKYDVMNITLLFRRRFVDKAGYNFLEYVLNNETNNPNSSNHFLPTSLF